MKLKSLAVVLVSTLLILFLIEGFLSYALVARKIIQPDFNSTLLDFDPELGWVTKPGSLRFKPAEGKMVCSGDSFTFGIGVEEQQTWCAILGGLNMGHIGYSVDQSYLYYMKQGVQLKPSVHVFAFIYDDLIRGAARPAMVLENGALKTDLSHVDKFSLLREKVYDRLSKLKTLYVLRNLLPSRNLVQSDRRVEDRSQVILKMFEELARKNNETGTKTVFVFLPVRTDLLTKSVWPEELKKEMTARGLVFIDLVAELIALQLPENDIQRMFFPKRSYDPARIEDHYTVEGHRKIAERLAGRLK